jgi:hypothetical protein
MHVTDVDRWLAAVAPYHLACLSEVFLIIGEDNEIVEGCDSVAARSESQVGGLSP